MPRRKYGEDKFFTKIEHTASSGVVGQDEYQIFGENTLRATATFATSGTLTIQGRIKHASTWDNLGTLASGGNTDEFDIGSYDFIRFNFTVAAGSTGEIAASGFFKGSSASGGAASSFTIMQPDAGTSPTADSATDTLTFTSSDASVTITGNSTTDTLDFVASGSSTVYSNPDATHASTEIFGASASVSNTFASVFGNSATASQYGTSVGCLAVSTDRTTSVGYDAGGTGTWQTNVGAFAGNTSTSGSSTSIGYNAQANGLYSVAVGLNTTAGIHALSLGGACAAGNYSTCLGYASTAGTDAVAIGWTMTAGADSVCMGYSSSTGVSGVSIGHSSNASLDAVSIGTSSNVTGRYANAIGRSCTVSGTWSTSIGAYNIITHNSSAIIGGNASSANANELLLGAGSCSFTSVVMGNGATNGVPNAVTLNNTNAIGTNIAGADLTIHPSRGTGTGVGGHLVFQTAAAGTTGSTLNTLTTQLELTDDGNVIMPNLPTSASGLPTGALWNNSGVINIA